MKFSSCENIYRKIETTFSFVFARKSFEKKLKKGFFLSKWRMGEWGGQHWRAELFLLRSSSRDAFASKPKLHPTENIDEFALLSNVQAEDIENMSRVKITNIWLELIWRSLGVLWMVWWCLPPWTLVQLAIGLLMLDYWYIHLPLLPASHHLHNCISFHHNLNLTLLPKRKAQYEIFWFQCLQIGQNQL